MNKVEQEKQKDLATKQRLLEAAGELFAERGFRDTNVRDICRRAGANIAAVNYHFRDKEGLYAAVFKYANVCASQARQTERESSDEASPEQRLHLFIRSLLGRFFDEGRPGWHMKLMTREMIEPTNLLDILIEENIRPFHTRLASIIRDLLGGSADEIVIGRCAFSVVAQCIFYRHNQPVVFRLCPEQKYGPEDIEGLADYIYKFSLGALEEFREQGERRQK
jgi:TetR/AcrR family transcriptional regulator, regulator of cefoperazone and chloramphenicol sensitivity